MNEDKSQAAITRASRAQVLLNDELLTEAFITLDAEYVRAWRSTDVRDDDARQRLWQAVQVLGKVREHLKKLVSDGKIAQKDIAQFEQNRRRFGAI